MPRACASRVIGVVLGVCGLCANNEVEIDGLRTVIMYSLRVELQT